MQHKPIHPFNTRKLLMRKISFFLCFFACGALLPLLSANTSSAQQPYGSVSPQTFTLQIMTLLDRFSADTELQKLRKRGYSAYIYEYTTEAGKVIYKIRSGKYANRSSAVVAAKEYQEQEGVAVMVVTASDDAPSGKARSAEKAVAEDSPEEKKPDRGKNVRIRTPDAGGADRPSSLQEKIAALERGEMPVQNKKTARHDSGDTTWFTLQVSTEPDKQSAERRINQLGRKGYAAYCVEAPLQNGKTLFKIRIGKYSTPEEAGEAAQKFNSQERRTCMVVKISPSGYIESEQAATAAARVQREEPEDIQAGTLQQARKSNVQKTDSPNVAEHETAADLPSEPEPSEPVPEHVKKASIPEVIESAERTENKSEQMETGDTTALENAPKRITIIYAYRTESGAINLTNRYEDIPETLRQNIQYISLFPVYIKDLSKSSSRLTLEADGQQTDIILAGFSMPKKTEPVRDYLETLKTKPLRLKYSPGQTTKDGAIAGRLFQKEGSYINLDMVRKGFGECSMQTLALDQQEAFRQAQEAAKRERVGIWAQ
jgi:septal ring-binding cell division protein DamX